MKNHEIGVEKNENAKCGDDPMNYKILDGMIDGRHFVISIFDDPEVVHHMKSGLQKFFKEYEMVKIKEKIKKETDHGYLSLSGNSSGCRRK